MAKALMLGSGAALPAKGRFNTSLAILEGARTLLIDCAQPASELLYHHGVDIVSVDTVVITHMHADHVSGVGQLAHLKHILFDNKPPRVFLDRNDGFIKDNLRHPHRNELNNVNPWLNIYVPAGVEETMTQYLSALYMRPEVFAKYSVSVLPYGEGEFHSDENFKLVAYPNAHIREFYPELQNTDAVLSSYTIMIETLGRKCLYSSDLASIEEIDHLVDGADTIFVEGAHFSPSELIRFAQEHKLEQVFVHHILATWEEEFARLARELAQANVKLTFDGFEVEL